MYLNNIIYKNLNSYKITFIFRCVILVNILFMNYFVTFMQIEAVLKVFLKEKRIRSNKIKKKHKSVLTLKITCSMILFSG